MNKKRYIVYFTQFSLLQHPRLNTKRIAFARECIFIESGYQRPVWIFNSRHAALNSAFSLPYISLNLHLAKLYNPRLRQAVVRALYPLYRGCRFPAPKWRVHFYIFDPRTSCRYAKNYAAPKEAILGRAAEQQSKPAVGRTRCRRMRAALAEMGCRLSCASLSGDEAGAFCVCSGGGTRKKHMVCIVLIQKLCNTYKFKKVFFCILFYLDNFLHFFR